MRAETKGKHEIGKRFAVVIGVAAVGVMALGAQTATAARGRRRAPPTCSSRGERSSTPQVGRDRSVPRRGGVPATPGAVASRRTGAIRSRIRGSHRELSAT